MHIVFVHPNFPAQFGHIGHYLVTKKGWKCTFISRTAEGVVGGIRKIQYKVRGGATRGNHYCSRTFENGTWNAYGVYEALKDHPEVKPDLIVGHSGFGSTCFLNELHPCPIINYFEYYYRTRHSDMDFRPEFPPQPMDYLRAHARNAMILLDLQTCKVGYSPTKWQRSLFPTEYQSKVEAIFDGIDTTLYRRLTGIPRQIGQYVVDKDVRIVTYVSRGFEAMRGFDIFMRVAKKIYTAYPNVIFFVVGSERTCYGSDLRHIKTKTFREHVLQQDKYDMSKFIFTGMVPPATLAQILSLTDLHIYLTVPFVLSWSMVDAMACGAVVLGADVPPIAEFITHGKNGLLGGFYDVDKLASLAIDVMKDPKAYRPLGDAAAALVQDQYSLEKTSPKLLSLFDRALASN
jgi:glycosyltransferase involved in cell wall biosynthesis